MTNKKTIAIILSVVLVCTAVIGGTIAYFSAKGEVQNTFTIGNIDLKLDESDESTPDNPDDRTEEGNEYDNILPGDQLVKDPTVTVEANSEDCYLFVMIDNKFPAAEYTVEDIWTVVATSGTKTIYKYNVNDSIVANSAEDQKFVVFDGVTIPGDAELVEGETGLEIDVMSFAHQVRNVTYDIAFDAAKTAFDSAAEWVLA